VIFIAIGAAACLGAVHWFAYAQGYLAGGEEAYRQGYNAGFSDATDCAKRNFFDWQKPSAPKAGPDQRGKP
jgi:hypothetical protein